MTSLERKLQGPELADSHCSDSAASNSIARIGGKFDANTQYEKREIPMMGVLKCWMRALKNLREVADTVTACKSGEPPGMPLIK